MDGYYNLLAYASSQISKHDKYSAVVPHVLARFATQISVKKRLSNRRHFLIDGALFGPEESQHMFGRKWLAESKIIFTKLIDLYSWILFYATFVCEIKVLVAAMKSLDQFVYLLGGIYNGYHIINIIKDD